MAFQVLPPTHAYSSSVVSPMCENRSLRQHSRGLWWAGASVGWWESGGGQKTLLAAYSWLPSPLWSCHNIRKSGSIFFFVVVCFVFSLSQCTTLNNSCHLVKVICSAAGPFSTTHSMNESQHQCQLLSINPQHDPMDFSFSDKCLWLIMME